MKKIKVAVTGGIGSGKSTVLRLIHDMGYPVFSCDQIYKEIILSQAYIDKVKKVFPEAVQQGKVDRKILSKIIFEYPEKRNILNNLSHPLIMQKLFEEMNGVDGKLVFAEVPLLFEGNFENLFDKVIVVARGFKNRVKAIKERDCIREEDIERRIKSQFDYFSDEGLERLRKCNAVIIENNETIELLISKLENVISIF